MGRVEKKKKRKKKEKYYWTFGNWIERARGNWRKWWIKQKKERKMAQKYGKMNQEGRACIVRHCLGEERKYVN